MIDWNIIDKMVDKGEREGEMAWELKKKIDRKRRGFLSKKCLKL